MHWQDTDLSCVPSQVAEHSENGPVTHPQSDKQIVYYTQVTECRLSTISVPGVGGGGHSATPQDLVESGLILGSSLSQTSSLTVFMPPEGRTHTHVTALVCVPSQVAEHTEKSALVHLQTDKTD